MEQDQHPSPSRAEQRMQAVLKLKRAASLPRMKDGRRPPMHVEAVSEGEKGGSDDDKKSDSSPPDAAVEPPTEVEMEVEVEIEMEATMDEGERTMSPGPAPRSKRRSRSRSRSRSSKDFKGKFRGAQSPTSSPFVNGDSSPDEEPPIPQPINIAEVAPLLSPIPSHFAELQRSRLLLRSPTPMSPEPQFYPGSSPSTPLLPSLEALQRGLFRSNSASGSHTAGRMMAMHKLTGGTEVYDPSTSPAPAPLPGKLSRNNTVSGGERVAARQFMLSRLGGRFTKDADGDQISGGDDIPSPSPTPKRKRRRSRRGSTTANAGVSDSEFLSTTPSTPVPPATPLPTTFDSLAELRAESTTPYGAANPPTSDIEKAPEFPPAEELAPDVAGEEKTEHPRRRSVVVEDDDEERYPPVRMYTALPSPTAQRSSPVPIAFHVGHASDVPSNGSVDSASPSGISVPLYLSRRAPSGLGSFPSSPFTTPLEGTFQRDDDEEEQVVYHADSYRSRTPYDEHSDREISWIADPVPVHASGNEEVVLQDRKQGQEEEEEEQSFEYPSLSPRSSNEFTEGHQVYDDTSPRASSDSKSLIVESDTSQDTVPSYPLSPSLSQTPSVTPASDDSTSFQTYPTRLSVASRSGDWDDRILNTDISSKRSSEPLSTWEKMKSTFTRTGSTSGRRSRTNSIRERRDHTDSSISRESGVSLTSAKADKGEPVSSPAQQPTPQPLMQSPSASASIVSLASHAQRGGASPIPAASTADLAKYQDAKLFPFPGMIQLEEQRNRAKGLPLVSASSPDIAMTAGGNDEEPNIPFPSSAGHTPPDMTRERKLSHQASDSRLVTRYNFPGSFPSQAEYLNVTPQPPAQNGSSLNLKLPMTLPGVKQWLSKNNKKKLSSPAFSPPLSTPPSPPAVDVRPLQAIKKQPSLTDLLRRKDSELGTDWEEINSTPTSASGDTIPGKRTSDSLTLVREGPAVNGAARSEQHADTEKISKVKKLTPLADKNGNIQPYDEPLSPLPRPDLLSPPSSSLSIYPSHSTSGSSSTSSSQYSLRPLRHVGPQGALVLERLEENLARGSRSAIWASAIDDPARKLLLSSPVVQVVNANHVKDRFLLLFNDILIIAKPIIPDQDTFTETLKPNPLDRKFVVKSVVMLHQLRFHADRTDQPSKSSGYTITRNPVIKSFVQNFADDPDHAVSSLFSKPRTADDPVVLGQLLFRTLDLDRARLGEYLSKRSSKPVLKAYLDNFGFYGLRVDRALRVFLHSMAAPTRTAHHLEYFLDAFAGRWYDANSSVVEYDKDTAHRLVRAIVQLNDLLHGGIAYEPGPTGYRQREVTSRDFLEAFRRYDPRCLVSDELLEDIYESMLREKLSQSRDTTSGSVADIITIVIKRPIPVRLTWKMQSEPIVLRIPHTDPHLSIRLYGQDLVFDPPFLTFAKSPEASFRVTGTSLGSKSLVMRRSGPNALIYAGLPLSTTVIVERAFMRHTFQMAFLNHNGMKRRYMFSVEDPLIRHQWALSLRRHVDQASASFKLSSTGSSKLQRAADRLAFRVLQETLIGMPPAFATHHPQRHKDPTRLGHNASDHSFSDPQPPHIRSKSRSKLYHRHGAGKHEPNIPYGVAERDENLLSDDRDLQPRNEGPLWTARELELHCLHSSSIASVLSYLTPENGEHNSS